MLNDEAVAQWSHVVQCGSIPTKPRENLLSERSVVVFGACTQSPMGAWVADTGVRVLERMPLIQYPELDLLEERTGLPLINNFTASV